MVWSTSITPWRSIGELTHSSTHTFTDYCSASQCDSLSLSLILRPTVSRSVCLGIKQTSGDYDQIFITVTQLRVLWCGELSLTRGRVCSLQLLLALASALIFGADSRRTRGHILLCQIRDFPFRRLLDSQGNVEVFEPASTRETVRQLTLWKDTVVRR
jgi:hypothetical protein